MRSPKSAINEEEVQEEVQEEIQEDVQEDLNEKENNARNLGREQKNRQKGIDGLYDSCPLCSTAITSPDVANQFMGLKFYLLQHAANNDNTGYETYRCDFCNRFFCHVISDSQIMITPQFTVIPLGGGMGAGTGTTNPFTGFGNGDGRANKGSDRCQ